MFDFTKLYNALPLYGQVLLTLGLVLLALVAAWRGLVGSKKEPHEDPRFIPTWVMMGPIHDGLQSIHGMAEEFRTQTAILKDIDKSLNRMDIGQAYTHKVLEAMLRNQEMRADYVPPAHPRRRN